MTHLVSFLAPSKALPSTGKPGLLKRTFLSGPCSQGSASFAHSHRLELGPVSALERRHRGQPIYGFGKPEAGLGRPQLGPVSWAVTGAVTQGPMPTKALNWVCCSEVTALILTDFEQGACIFILSWVTPMT